VGRAAGQRVLEAARRFGLLEGALPHSHLPTYLPGTSRSRGCRKNSARRRCPTLQDERLATLPSRSRGRRKDSARRRCPTLQDERLATLPSRSRGCRKNSARRRCPTLQDERLATLPSRSRGCRKNSARRRCPTLQDERLATPWWAGESERWTGGWWWCAGRRCFAKRLARQVGRQGAMRRWWETKGLWGDEQRALPT
jgi:hypothetical protein